MPYGMNLLEAARINAVIQGLQDVRTLPQELKFLQRTPLVPAVDSEVLARFVGYVQIADLIADDAAALTYNTGKISMESTTIPNIKVGAHLTQEMLNMLNAIKANGAIQNDEVGIFSNYESRMVDMLLLGVRQRMEALIVACALDGMSYNRLGIQMSGVTWGMPSDLKVTPSTTWDTAASATPVNDILGVKLIGRVRYGIEYDRVTMSTQAFRYMIATTEFQAKARQYLAPNVSYVNLALSSLDQQRKIGEAVLGMEIELYDARYWSQDAAGATTQAPYLPINKVILSYSGNDNNPNAINFANAVTTESIVSSLIGNQNGSAMIGQFNGPERGPIAYATGPKDLNPPNITYWAVARGFPRKWQLQSTAVLTVGSFSDQIAVGVPF